MRNRVIGQTAWVVADDHLPAWSNGPPPETIGHESVSMPATGEVWAYVEMQTPLPDRDPVGLYRMTMARRYCRQGHRNDPGDREPIPKGGGYSSIIRAYAPVAVQPTRLDSGQLPNAHIGPMTLRE
ncbi:MULTISPECIES: sensory rhodopsin transducer [Acidiferrobacter]|uniref:Sensory rhodopsin transducer n=1 Tax=Acidiferrobacter thiooxydans TaxID=163359 RepID=A0A368HCG5_9GAMM|nr:sensory rhodopsin transducer [Gammaproteobacteria bacterium]RCN56135.1 sensory rhodopsin transducer [Acidiferrobacter thiooxydans]UEN98580.1 hypothetical protein A9R16_009025 [Acidiferrobacter thiooxydans]